ncbi:MAG: hypothetical protein PHR38_02950 [Bacteroidales bacterium]|nr:hypothetical protein [Bacteroidales bacterium]MDD3907545.1 hypothetical protein [Bacteroidales bacterium]MDD4712018.1 hypothetical protein [Bacteroidales bacterium]
MKCFAAQYFCSGKGKIGKKQILCLDDEGVLLSIRSFNDETASTAFLNGVLCPAFGLPGSKAVLAPDEAGSLLKRVLKINPGLPVGDFLAIYTNVPDLEIGSKPRLWCIEPLDLKKLLLLDDSSVYSIFP